MLKIRNPKATYKKEFELYGDTFTMEYRLISSFEYRDIENKHSDGGNIPGSKILNFMRELNSAVWVGWEDVKDENEKELEFSIELIEHFPMDLQMQIYSFYLNDVINPKFKKMEKLSKNSKSTPN